MGRDEGAGLSERGFSWHSRAVDPAPSTERTRPRLGIIVRMLIYLPLLGFFGWRATQRFVEQRRVVDDNFRASVQRWVEHPPKSVVLPNGEVMPVLELSEGEAIEMGLLPEGGRPEAAGSPDPQPEPAPEPTPAPTAAPAPAPAPGSEQGPKPTPQADPGGPAPAPAPNQ